MIATDSLMQIRDVDLSDLIGRAYPEIKLKKGSGKCPFHNEKTGSFNVKKSLFKCFGCGAGGDVIQFVQDHERLEFHDAVERIAGLMNITLDYDESYDKEAAMKLRAEQKSLKEILAEVHARYRSLLWKETGEKAMAYLKGRGYDQEVITEWRLGYAPAEWRLIAHNLKGRGLGPSAVKLYILKENDKGFYDFFRNRIIFPIVNETGELVTLAGRTLAKEFTKENPKYLNTANTPLYTKSKVLFGLYQAIPYIKKYGFANLVEGYTDVISMHMQDAKNTVGTCGTALTVDMCKLLGRFTKKVVLMRDDDEAGAKATIRDMELLYEQGFKVDVFPLTNGQDPDDWAKSFVPAEEAEEDATNSDSIEEQVPEEVQEESVLDEQGIAALKNLITKSPKQKREKVTI